MSIVVGDKGNLDERARLFDFEGSWAKSLQHLNQLIEDLTQPTKETICIIGAIRKGIFLINFLKL